MHACYAIAAAAASLLHHSISAMSEQATKQAAACIEFKASSFVAISLFSKLLLFLPVSILQNVHYTILYN